MASFLLPMWIIPRVAVALNLFQLVAEAAQPRLSLRKESFVVKAFMIELVQIVAPWMMELF